MKRKNILRITVLPVVLVTVLAFTNLQPQKGKDDKGSKSQEQAKDKEKGQENKGNDKDHNSQGKDDNSNKGNNQVKDNDSQGNNSGQGNNDKSYGNSNKGRDNENKGNAEKHGNGNSKNMNGKRDVDIDWNLNNFSDRKHPKDQKKVAICHNPSENDSNNGVTINVSENAVQAHMNHGDKMGNCTIDYSDRWSPNYVKSRENVYNTYEQTWETMSYSEALLKVALQKLLGVRTNFDQNRATYTSQELQRREALIYDLQNNVTSLENQLGVTRQRLDSDVNIIIKL